LVTGRISYEREGIKSFGFSEGGKLEQGMGGKPEHGSGGKILFPEGKDHEALVSIQKAGSWWNQQNQYTTKMCNK
jgi:hypothetical protein